MVLGGGMVGGPRQYEGPTLGQITAWRCPACGIDNTSVFEDGCPSCGAGSAKARHVGVPPTGKTAPTNPTPTGFNTSGTQPLTVDAAFAQWITAYPSVTNPAMRELLREAWRVAIDWYRLSTNTFEPQTETSPLVIPEAGLNGVLVPRALLTKVIAVLDATFDLPEEQQSDELRLLIAQLKELND